MGVQANRSRFRTTYGLNYVNPYYTEDGVSRGFSLFFSETDFDEINVATYSTNRYGGSMIFGYPINETQSHPNTPVLGWDNAYDIINQCKIPIFLLGGVNKDSLDRH